MLEHKASQLFLDFKLECLIFVDIFMCIIIGYLPPKVFKPEFKRQLVSLVFMYTILFLTLILLPTRHTKYPHKTDGEIFSN